MIDVAAQIHEVVQQTECIDSRRLGLGLDKIQYEMVALSFSPSDVKHTESLANVVAFLGYATGGDGSIDRQGLPYCTFPTVRGGRSAHCTNPNKSPPSASIISI